MGWYLLSLLGFAGLLILLTVLIYWGWTTIELRLTKNQEDS